MVFYWFGKREFGKFTNEIPVIGGPTRPPPPNHVAIVGQKANRKLNGLVRIKICMELPKNRVLMNAVFYNKI